MPIPDKVIGALASESVGVLARAYHFATGQATFDNIKSTWPKWHLSKKRVCHGITSRSIAKKTSIPVPAATSESCLSEPLNIGENLMNHTGLLHSMYIFDGWCQASTQASTFNPAGLKPYTVHVDNCGWSNMHYASFWSSTHCVFLLFLLFNLIEKPSPVWARRHKQQPSMETMDLVEDKNNRRHQKFVLHAPELVNWIHKLIMSIHCSTYLDYIVTCCPLVTRPLPSDSLHISKHFQSASEIEWYFTGTCKQALPVTSTTHFQTEEFHSTSSEKVTLQRRH